ncbi:MAG: ABC transporter permease [Spirochaetota bacterium]
MATFRSFLHYIAAHPLRSVLTILTIAIGVGALVITFSLSIEVGGALDRALSAEGRIVVVANAEIADDGSIERQLPSPLDARAPQLLASDYENLGDVTTVAAGRWSRIAAEGTTYQVRSSASVGASYASLMGLELLAGDFFSGTDVEERAQVVVISESSARILFGSPGAAIGQTIRTAITQVAGGADGPALRRTQQPFTVVGVFEDVSELEREAFGVADFLIPGGTGLPPGLAIGFDPTTVIMARLTADALETAESRVRSILELAYGEEVVVGLWEGSPAGPAPIIEESRRSISSFTLTINVLGLVILVASSIGIFSVMLVEVLNRMREIGLRRALGSTRAGIRRFFLAHAMLFALAGSVVGIVLAAIFYRPIGSSLAPFFDASGLAASDLSLSSPSAVAVVLSTAAAAIIGALFGFVPAISASRIPIVEAIRDDAA